MTEIDRAAAVGAALRRLRGTRDQTEAATLSGLSRQWWIDNEKGLRVARANKLVIAARALGGDARELLELAGYDPEPFMDHISSPDDAESGTLDELMDEIRSLDGEMRSLAGRVQALEGRLAPSPPEPRRASPARVPASQES